MVSTGAKAGSAIVELFRVVNEEWYYDGFSISFFNSDGLDSWRFDTRPGRISARYTFNHRTDSLSGPVPASASTESHTRWQASGTGTAYRVELAYALPKYNVSASEADSGFVLENGVFLFDENGGTRCIGSVLIVNLSWPALTPSGYPVVDSLRNSHRGVTIGIQGSVRYVPNLVGEVRERKRGSIGTFREERGFATADTVLSLSDLLLATQIETGSPFPEKRSHLNVVGNPLRTYHRSEPAFIYLEVYNLNRDE